MPTTKTTDRTTAKKSTRAVSPEAGSGLPIPAGLVALGRYAGQVGRRYAVVNAVEARARALEDRVLNGLGERLQRVRGTAGGEGSRSTSRAEARPGIQRTYVVSMFEPPEQRLKALLDAAARQDADSARAYLYSSLLQQIVPDEARLLGTFAGGRVHAALHVEAAARFSGDRQRIASFLTLLAEPAGVMLPGMVGYYVGHLLALGLLEEGEPTAETRAVHGSLQNLAAAKEASTRIAQARMKSKLVFASLTMSLLGEELWTHARGEGGGGQPRIANLRGHADNGQSAGA